MMFCTCERARREARAEAFEEAAKAAVSFLRGDPINGVPFRSPTPHEIAEHIRRLAATERAAHAPKPPVNSGIFAQAMQGVGLTAAALDRTVAKRIPVDPIVDCVEDGWTTEHVTPDSYPFEALDPWPEDADVDGGRGGA
jgi:hypothetical protein